MNNLKQVPGIITRGLGTIYKSRCGRLLAIRSSATGQWVAYNRAKMANIACPSIERQMVQSTSIEDLDAKVGKYLTDLQKGELKARFAYGFAYDNRQAIGL